MTNTQHNRDDQAVLLLCGRFGNRETEPLPLGLKEYNALVQWLAQNHITLGHLFDFVDANFDDISFPLEPSRVISLLDRGAVMAMAIENWMNQGIWIITRSGSDYPARIQSHLGNAAPPLLYGIGSREILAEGGLAIVGSRTINAELSGFTRRIGEKAAESGINVISGGAAGVDETAMTAALHEGGRVAGVLSENLSRQSRSKVYRDGIIANQLVLVSPYHPDASFNTGNAMGRNKCIYALADVALAVTSSYGIGGTWAGLQEEMKRSKRRKLWMYMGHASPPDNARVLEAIGLEGVGDELLDGTILHDLLDSEIARGALNSQSDNVSKALKPDILSAVKDSTIRAVSPHPEEMKLPKLKIFPTNDIIAFCRSPEAWMK